MNVAAGIGDAEEVGNGDAVGGDCDSVAVGVAVGGGGVADWLGARVATLVGLGAAELVGDVDGGTVDVHAMASATVAHIAIAKRVTRISTTSR